MRIMSASVGGIFLLAGFIFGFRVGRQFERRCYKKFQKRTEPKKCNR